MTVEKVKAQPLSSQEILDLLGGSSSKRPRASRAWKSVLAPRNPTPNLVKKTIRIPGWLYDKFFFRSIQAGVPLEDVIVHELTKTEIPDPVRGDQERWLVSNTENLYARPAHESARRDPEALAEASE